MSAVLSSNNLNCFEPVMKKSENQTKKGLQRPKFQDVLVRWLYGVYGGAVKAAGLSGMSEKLFTVIGFDRIYRGM